VWGNVGGVVFVGIVFDFKEVGCIGFVDKVIFMCV